MADFVVGASIQTNTYNLINSGITASTTVPFSGINSYDFTGVTPGSNGSYVPAFGRVCWGLNDFTLECFIRGNGTDDPEGNVFYVPLNSGLANTNFGRNILVKISASGEIIITNTTGKTGAGPSSFTTRKNSGSPTPLDPSTWYHLAIIRKDNKVSILFDGEVLVRDIESDGNFTSALYSTSRTTDFSSLGLMFVPFGGLNTTYSMELNEMVLGSISGDTNFKNFDGLIANFRSSYIAQYDVTQTSYTVPSAAFTGAESGTDYYVDTFSGAGQNNSGTALPRGGINGVVVDELVLENTALGSVTTVEEDNANYPIELNTNFAGIALGNIDILVEESLEVTGVSATSSLSSVGAGLGILVPVTQLTANTSLGSVNIPILWSKIQTGTTTNWTEVDTG